MKRGRMVSVSILAAMVMAAEAIAPAPVVTPPDWRRIPTLDEMADHYPGRARAMGVDGEVVLKCAVSTAARLEKCAVQSQSPPDLGFGEAALSLTPLFEVSPKRVNGEAVGGALVAFRIAFKLPFDERIDLPEALRCYGLLSAHLELAPDDDMLAKGVAYARSRAEVLARAKGETAGLEQRLARAADQTPRPSRAGATRDICFQLFL